MNEKERLEVNENMKESQREGVKVKLLDDKGYYIQGALGVGFGAWSRAGYIQKFCGLSQLPESISREDWLRMDGAIQLVPWKA